MNLTKICTRKMAGEVYSNLCRFFLTKILLIQKCGRLKCIFAYYLVFTYAIPFCLGGPESSFHVEYLKKGDRKLLPQNSIEAQSLLKSSNKVKRSASARSAKPQHEASFHMEYVKRGDLKHLSKDSKAAQLLFQTSNKMNNSNKKAVFKPNKFSALVSVPGTPENSDGRFPAMCFKDIGCFSCEPPFFNFLFRTLCALPNNNLNMDFLLYTVENPTKSYVLDFSDKSFNQSSFNNSFPTKVIIPGFNTTLKSQPEFYQIKDEFLKQSPYNVIIVDWTADDNFPYQQAVANGRAVGGLTALVLRKFKEIKGMTYGSVHMIGHSLGAHIAGWAGQRLNKIGRITGLDPAGVFFQHASAEVRLAKGDAEFVDIIHTDAATSIVKGFGLKQAIGDIDFYPNGGTHQPACGRSTLFDLPTVRMCDHSMSLKYFKSSISTCKYPSVLCGNYEDFLNNRCNSENSVVDYMGFHAKKVENAGNGSLKFYLGTSSSPPYCEAKAVRTYTNWIVNLLEELIQLPMSFISWCATTLENTLFALYIFFKKYF